MFRRQVVVVFLTRREKEVFAILFVHVFRVSSTCFRQIFLG